MTGIFYLIGVGPGDPELMTLKAARILGEVAIVAFPQKPGSSAFAYDIAKSQIGCNVTLLPIALPMKKQRQPAQDAYDGAAKEITNYLQTGQSVAYLCEGDPLIYGSAMYLLSRLSSQFDVEIVPGISSLNAGAAAIGRPLAARNERLKVLPATLDHETLVKELETTEAAVIIKIGGYYKSVKKALETTGHGRGARIVQYASGPDQQVSALDQMQGDSLPYFSIIICYKGDEDWGNDDWGKERWQQ